MKLVHQWLVQTPETNYLQNSLGDKNIQTGTLIQLCTYRHKHAWGLPVCSTATKEAHNEHEYPHCQEDVYPRVVAGFILRHTDIEGWIRNHPY